MEREDKKGIFFGVIGVITLIVAIIGASFAYFSINTKSNPDAITVNAASVQIVYDDGQELVLNDLIPSTQAVALETQRRALAGEQYTVDEEGNKANYEICKDDKGYTVCGIYEFTLTNNGVNPVDVTATVEPTALQSAVLDEKTGEVITPAEKRFNNLKFIMYDISSVTESTPVDQKNGTKLYEGTVGYSKFGLLSDDITAVNNLPGNGTVKKFRLFIWLNEAGEANNVEQGATFKGTVHIDISGVENGNITDEASTIGG